MPCELAVVIVSYNTCDLLRRSLHSVYAAARPPECALRVVVVDNASRDQSAAMVAAEFPQARLFASPVNLGFTGGNNLALHSLGLRVPPPATGPRSLISSLIAAPDSAPPHFVLLLNPDAELYHNALCELLAAMQRIPAAGALGAHLHYADGSFQHGAFRFPGLAQVALDLFPLTGVPGAHRLHNSRLNGRYPAAAWQGDAPFPVDFVLGAALLARAAAINDIGGLDDNYFMYCEEMDWCLRAGAKGWGVYAVPTAHVLHHAGQSSQQVRWDAFVRLWQSRFRFYHLHYSPSFRWLLRRLVRLGTAWRIRHAQQRFARGTIDGIAVGQELAAYASLRRL